MRERVEREGLRGRGKRKGCEGVVRGMDEGGGRWGEVPVYNIEVIESIY